MIAWAVKAAVTQVISMLHSEIDNSRNLQITEGETNTCETEKMNTKTALIIARSLLKSNDCELHENI